MQVLGQVPTPANLHPIPEALKKWRTNLWRDINSTSRFASAWSFVSICVSQLVGGVCRFATGRDRLTRHRLASADETVTAQRHTIIQKDFTLPPFLIYSLGISGRTGACGGSASQTSQRVVTLPAHEAVSIAATRA